MNIKEYKEKIAMSPKHGGTVLDKEEMDHVSEFCERYKNFLNKGKTERECVAFFVDEAEKRGFVPFDKGIKYGAGEKFYLNNRSKAAIFAVAGTRPLEDGVKIVAAHIDAPRLDLKPRPIYEESQLGLMKTHYYGGLKKYQWTAIPLAFHGAIALKDGTTLDIVIGEDENDPVFCVSDLLPHLASEQMKRTLGDAIQGEELNVISGSLPLQGEDDEGVTELVKLNILSILHEKYGILEEDFLSGDVEIVPAFKAKDIGFDRSLIGAYGHDDRVCAYTAMEALFANETPEFTTIVVLADKEEIGSTGATGLKGHFMRYFINDLADMAGAKYTTVMSNSKCLSADVNAAFDPTFPTPYEKNNTAYLNYGIAVSKYTGSRGKSGTSEATAEFVSYIRNIFDKNEVMWQMAELGKVDAGGGGTVAMYVAELDIDVIDVGVPVISMHAPLEVVSKIDTYMAFKAFDAFFA